MNVSDIITVLESIAPLRFAAEWDNVGLLAGSRAWNADSVLLTIDLTEPVLREAIDSKAGLIVSYHPPIFEALKSLTDATLKQRIVLEAIAAGIAVYSPHTALDAAPGGLNDWFAEGLGPGDVRALQWFSMQPDSEQCKVITYCPEAEVEKIRNGLASIGAGQIGEYRLCSFEIRGRGTFLAGEGTNPAVGRKGELNRVDEVRLEMVCPTAALGLAVLTIREFHSYEEPPIEIIRLQPHPQRNIGQGRRIVLDQPLTINALADRMKKHLGVSQVHAAQGDGAPNEYERIGLCAGAGGSLLDAALEVGCQLFLTGEMRHHDVLNAQARGCTIVLAGHTNTERGYLKPLRDRLLEKLAGVKVNISRRDSDPLRAM